MREERCDGNVHGRHIISAEKALLLIRTLGTAPEFWINFEEAYLLKTFDEAPVPQVLALPQWFACGIS